MLPIPPLPILQMTTDPSPPPHRPQPEGELTELPEGYLNCSCLLSGVCLVLTGSARGLPRRACVQAVLSMRHTLHRTSGDRKEASQGL